MNQCQIYFAEDFNNNSALFTLNNCNVTMHDSSSKFDMKMELLNFSVYIFKLFFYLFFIINIVG